MTALRDYRNEAPRSLADQVIAQLPESVFGNSEWATMTARTGAEHLRAAIALNRPHRVANAVRSMAHAPSLDQVETLAQTICDTIVADGYARHDSEAIARVANARRVVAAAIGELRGSVTAPSPDSSLLRDTVNGFVRIIGLSDPQLAERLDAVGLFAARIARSMNLTDETVLEVELAGRLSDIGMVDVARGNRTKRERHPAIGELLLRAISPLAHLAPIVRSHHERYDGQGYPDALRGEDIPLASRIIGVAEAFVDLVTATPHLEASLPHEAGRELMRRAGTEFDPAVVAATLHLLRYRQRADRSA